jgi:hypothetical protein
MTRVSRADPPSATRDGTATISVTQRHLYNSLKVIVVQQGMVQGVNRCSVACLLPWFQCPRESFYLSNGQGGVGYGDRIQD